MERETARILLVDDEQDLVWALRHSLSDEGYKVLAAGNGAEALALAQRKSPDLVILDIVMPGLDGLEVCRRLRRDPALAAVPILFLTVRNDIEDQVIGLDGGADDYLVKPFDVRELKARVRALLRRSQFTTGEAHGIERQDSVLAVGSLSLDLHRRQVAALRGCGDPEELRFRRALPLEYARLQRGNTRRQGTRKRPAAL